MIVTCVRTTTVPIQLPIAAPTVVDETTVPQNLAVGDTYTLKFGALNNALNIPRTCDPIKLVARGARCANTLC